MCYNLQMIWIVFVVLFAFISFLYYLTGFNAPKPATLRGAHVLITGGSSGIGKYLAMEAAQGGANITLLARNQAKLQEAKKEIEDLLRDGSKQSVSCVSVDVSRDPCILEQALKETEAKYGPITILINCAGTSSSAKFMDTPLEEFHRLMDVNYHGTVLVTQTVLPSLLKKKGGRITFVSSMAGQLGLFGYTAYSASKFALRGFAESLQMELKPHNIQVTLAFPPDTDTPGFAEEQKMKPRETKLVSESGGLFTPQVVARQIMADTLQGKFFSSIGIDGYMLSMATAGFSPVSSFLDAAQQTAEATHNDAGCVMSLAFHCCCYLGLPSAKVVFMGLFRLICIFYLLHFDRIVKKCKDEDEAASSGSDKKKS